MADRMTIEEVSIESCHPAPWNVRTGHAVEAIAESIRVNGFRDPIEVWRDTGDIVCGEGRWLAAQHLDHETVPVIYHDFDSLASAKRYAIANNRLTDRSEWDAAALRDQLKELDSLAGTGFDDEFFRDPHERSGFDYGDDDEEADDEMTGEAATSHQTVEDGIPMALSIVLVTAAEKGRWLDWKTEVGVSTDKAALLALLGRLAEETEDA